MTEKITFPPYVALRDSVAQITEFAQLTELSYGLAQQLLFKHPKGSLPPVARKKLSPSDLSYSMADREVTSVELVCGWVTIADYASRLNVDASELVELAQRGGLGPTELHPESGEILVVWPPECQSRAREELPVVGKNKYQVTLTVKAHASLDANVEDESSYEATQAEFLRLAHALGSPSQVAERAREVANRAILLLYWTAFEVFLRSTVREMMRRHPGRLAFGKRGQETLTYSEVATFSSGFTSAEQLLERLLERELDRSESGGESVHGLINYIKSQFRFEADLYKAWYVLNGERHETSFSELKQLKDTRNALVHDGGRVSERFARDYPDVPTRDGVIVVSDSFLLRGTLLLDSLAFHLAQAIENHKFAVA